ncbi:uncharacterized protein G2W53_035063 [Senna tora]|uniref:Uncharacterized protein n=1 Tax=Senna tora TaxID=362788 RepID=A0A834SSV7_9FABA|nr:uncharacterized protein G2W53_035063 [Senna tora]
MKEIKGRGENVPLEELSGREEHGEEGDEGSTDGSAATGYNGGEWLLLEISRQRYGRRQSKKEGNGGEVVRKKKATVVSGGSRRTDDDGVLLVEDGGELGRGYGSKVRGGRRRG